MITGLFGSYVVGMSRVGQDGAMTVHRGASAQQIEDSYAAPALLSLAHFQRTAGVWRASCAGAPCATPVKASIPPKRHATTQPHDHTTLRKAFGAVLSTIIINATYRSGAFMAQVVCSYYPEIVDMLRSASAGFFRLRGRRQRSGVVDEV